MHSTIGSTVHSMPLNSLEHCICTTTSRPGFEPDTPRLQAPVDTNEPSGPTNRGLTILKKSAIIIFGVYVGLRRGGGE